jgi:hypothetical protein
MVMRVLNLLGAASVLVACTQPSPDMAAQAQQRRTPAATARPRSRARGPSAAKPFVATEVRASTAPGQSPRSPTARCW